MDRMLVREETVVPAVVFRIQSVHDPIDDSPVPPSHPDAGAAGGLLYVRRPTGNFALKCQRLDRPITSVFADIALLRDMPFGTEF